MNLRNLTRALAVAFVAGSMGLAGCGGGGGGPWSLSGRLESGDQQLDDGTWFDAYATSARKDGTATVSMTPSGFDAYLAILENVGGNLYIVAEVDDGGDNQTESVQFSADDEADFIIIANSFYLGEGGSYSIRGNDVLRKGSRMTLRVRQASSPPLPVNKKAKAK